MTKQFGFKVETLDLKPFGSMNRTIGSFYRMICLTKDIERLKSRGKDPLPSQILTASTARSLFQEIMTLLNVLTVALGPAAQYSPSGAL